MYNKSNNDWYSPCQSSCNNKCDHSWDCKCDYHCGCNHGCTKEEIYCYLGEYIYDILKCVDLPPSHPSLDDSLCALIQGKPLPPCHPTLDQILCEALGCSSSPCSCMKKYK